MDGNKLNGEQRGSMDRNKLYGEQRGSMENKLKNKGVQWSKTNCMVKGFNGD